MRANDVCARVAAEQQERKVTRTWYGQKKEYFETPGSLAQKTRHQTNWFTAWPWDTWRAQQVKCDGICDKPLFAVDYTLFENRLRLLPDRTTTRAARLRRAQAVAWYARDWGFGQKHKQTRNRGRQREFHRFRRFLLLLTVHDSCVGTERTEPSKTTKPANRVHVCWERTSYRRRVVNRIKKLT